MLIITNIAIPLIRTIFYFWKPVIFGFIIFTLCLIPANTISEINIFEFNFLDLIVHFSMFFIFSFLLAYDLSKHNNIGKSKLKPLFYTLFVALIISGTTEIFQYLFTNLNRSAQLADFILDLIGALTGALVIFLLPKLKEVVLQIK